MKLQLIQGLEDFGKERNNKLADHAYVFMVKGAVHNWIQPILFTFSSGPIKSDQLTVTIKTVIRECRKIGLHIVTAVCDQGTGNVAAINKLLMETNRICLDKGKENKYVGFVIDEEEIIYLYCYNSVDSQDSETLILVTSVFSLCFLCPSVFNSLFNLVVGRKYLSDTLVSDTLPDSKYQILDKKSLRNNLLSKDLHFTMNGKKMVAKWKHIIDFYLLDLCDDVRICPKLTDNHVIPEKINKMKVSLCTQVFSHTVGSLMKRISRWIIYERKEVSIMNQLVPVTAIETGTAIAEITAKKIGTAIAKITAIKK
ncbi:hypothetical protein NQ315_011284 [Exocentrus adspersus]|uniref:Uncharacterized protein n=1 Tax=Exocentrus adspersus TaxID=1586481 RepID=A0AAV8VJH8_9CUCU|nr:hypothetical protein NQ315_011284 [Exocentrus adspersus]